MISDFLCVLTSAKLSSADLALVIAAVNAQMRDDFAPAWERIAPVVAYSPSPTMPSDTDIERYIVCTFRDSTPDDPQGALAYHYVNPATGRAEIVVLVDVILSQPGATRDDVCIAFGHEVMETEGDEYANEWSDRGDGSEEPQEIVDRVQGYSYDKALGDVTIKVTDFLLPDAFDDEAPAGSKYDFCGKLTSAREIGAGGYAVTRPVGGGEATVMGDVKAARAFSCKALERHGVK